MTAREGLAEFVYDVLRFHPLLVVYRGFVVA